jgi:hypothetical protein
MEVISVLFQKLNDLYVDNNNLEEVYYLLSKYVDGYQRFNR